MKIVDTCCKWQITRYWSDGNPRILEAKIAEINEHPKYKNGWYLLIGDVESDAPFCLRCGRKLVDSKKAEREA